jgi:hypothetical protein
VAEETSASSEEASAAAEEQASSMEEITSTAQTLAELAVSMKNLVDQSGFMGNSAKPGKPAESPKSEAKEKSPQLNLKKEQKAKKHGKSQQ